MKNKIVMITGASSGIGAACAETFAKAGAKLLLCARRLTELEKIASHLRETYAIEVYPFLLDVSKAEAVQAAWETIPADWKNVSVLINNAGLAVGREPLQTSQTEDWDTMIDTNVKGLLYVTKAILPTMLANQAGHIINLGSIAGHQVYPNGAVYCATKAAVNFLTQGLRMDLLGTPIRVSTVDPGMVETNFSVVRFRGDQDQAAAIYKGVHALQASDVADTILYCATRPAHVNISEVIIMPTAQASVTQVSRQLS